MPKVNITFYSTVATGVFLLIVSAFITQKAEGTNIHTTKNFQLPDAPKPVGSYEAGIIRQGIGVVSGQFPMRDGQLAYTGQVGADLTTAQAREAAQIAALNVLAQIHDLTDGFRRLDGLLRVEGYISSASGFTNQATVLNAASEIFSEYLGEKGRHARAAFSVSQLPLNSPIELTVTFTTKQHDLTHDVD